MRYFILLAGIIILLASCTSMTSMQKESPRPPAPAPAPVKSSSPPPKPAVIYPHETGSAGSGSGVPRDSYVLMVRSFLYPNSRISNDSLNLIFFPKQPTTKEEKLQYQSLCETWKSSFPMEEEVAEQIKDDDVTVLPVYWLSRRINRDYSCDILVRNYDYARAQILAAKWKFDGTKVQLISRIKGRVIMMNLSPLKEPEDLLLAMNVWRTKMCPTPKNVTTAYTMNLLESAKRTLGAIGNLLTMK